ncbi:HxlR family transcriptional regulator [Murinocardiopsis flavida]|uniref:HxlR family transcriptional regulator n=1 Tax=Murinocardiopsis flavida TaxID=645275 RepID=A0A2P8CFB4_9ACTN|nr:helix-turn-helix domain-containing protein [Murinocardiopsis flavida]PSK83559.1 HxlR family transcriptional regulator [Murinocardiopsis flavida]
MAEPAIEDHTVERHCPTFQAAVELIGRRWNGAIVLAAERGARRFCEFAAAIPGMSERLLAQRLRELEDARIMIRTVEAGRPVSITYTLSERGEELARAVRPLIDWGERWLSEEMDGRQ